MIRIFKHGELFMNQLEATKTELDQVNNYSRVQSSQSRSSSSQSFDFKQNQSSMLKIEKNKEVRNIIKNEKKRNHTSLSFTEVFGGSFRSLCDIQFPTHKPKYKLNQKVSTCWIEGVNVNASGYSSWHDGYIVGIKFLLGVFCYDVKYPKEFTKDKRDEIIYNIKEDLIVLFDYSFVACPNADLLMNQHHRFLKRYDLVVAHYDGFFFAGIIQSVFGNRVHRKYLVKFFDFNHYHGFIKINTDTKKTFIRPILDESHLSLQMKYNHLHIDDKFSQNQYQNQYQKNNYNQNQNNPNDDQVQDDEQDIYEDEDEDEDEEEDEEDETEIDWDEELFDQVYW
ncbi:hypothetical protein RB653_001771 [Dictyostelium firmibasis]